MQRLRTVGEVFAGALAGPTRNPHCERERGAVSLRGGRRASSSGCQVSTRLRVFNKGWLDFTGRPMPQELGSGWVEGVHPDDVDRCLETYVGASTFDNRSRWNTVYAGTMGKCHRILDKGVRYRRTGRLSGTSGTPAGHHRAQARRCRGRCSKRRRT